MWQLRLFSNDLLKMAGIKKNNMQLLASNINKTITLQRQAFHQLIVQLIRVGVFNPSEKLLVKFNWIISPGRVGFKKF